MASVRCATTVSVIEKFPRLALSGKRKCGHSTACNRIEKDRAVFRSVCHQKCMSEDILLSGLQGRRQAVWGHSPRAS